MAREKRGLPPAVGGASMLVIIAVLCLTVLSMLSISDAQAELRLSNSAADSVSGYYSADDAAERILAQLRRGIMPDSVVRDGNIYSYCCPISDTMCLAVRVELYDGNYTVLQWQAQPSAAWQSDDSIELWDGITTGD